MASEWTPTKVYTAGSTITGTNANITDVDCYVDNGYWSSGTLACYCGTSYNGSRSSPTVVRFKIHPTKKLSKISIPLTQQAYNSSPYNTSRVKFYAKISTSGSDYPTTDVTSSTQYAITSAGQKNLEIPLSSPTSSDFYVYLWGARVNTSGGDLTAYFINITAIGAPTGTVATFQVTLSPATGVTYNQSSPQTVNAGAAFSFTVTIGANYMTNSSFAVKAGTTTLTPSSQNGKTYTYSVAINANTTITVTGVVLGGIVRIGSGSAWVNYQVYIGNGSQWVQYLPYIGTGSGWQLYS